jgi:hypothetical protein
MSRMELKNGYDVPLIVTTPDETIELPPGAEVFVFTDKMSVRVKATPVAADPTTDTQGATP